MLREEQNGAIGSIKLKKSPEEDCHFCSQNPGFSKKSMGIDRMVYEHAKRALNVLSLGATLVRMDTVGERGAVASCPSLIHSSLTSMDLPVQPCIRI